MLFREYWHIFFRKIDIFLWGVGWGNVFSGHNFLWGEGWGNVLSGHNFCGGGKWRLGIWYINVFRWVEFFCQGDYRGVPRIWQGWGGGGWGNNYFFSDLEICLSQKPLSDTIKSMPINVKYFDGLGRGSEGEASQSPPS